jgi:hypothetical protein
MAQPASPASAQTIPQTSAPLSSIEPGHDATNADAASAAAITNLPTAAAAAAAAAAAGVMWIFLMQRGAHNASLCLLSIAVK